MIPFKAHWLQLDARSSNQGATYFYFFKSNVTCRNYTPIQLQQCHVLMIHCDSVKASSRDVAYIAVTPSVGGNKKLLSTRTHARTHTHSRTHTHTCAHTHTRTHKQTKTQQQQTRNMKLLLFDDKYYQLQQLNYFCMTVTPNVCDHNTH